MSIKRLCDAFEPIQRANTGEELRREMERFAKQMGFDRYVYALKITAPSLIPQEYLLSGYPEGWVNRYVSRGYFKIDPIVRQCEHSTLPVLWDEHMVAETDVSEFWEEAHSFGLRAGLSFTVREQPGVTGILSLSRDQSIDLEEPELAAIIGRAQVFASVLHYAVARIDLPRLIPQARIPLTARERECIKWAADGKTAWEIGKILGITERTAIFHTNNITRKLGAVNKTQAIVRALALNLV
jgi:LuxR family quorum-sensing system transcriptional regulator SolR